MSISTWAPELFLETFQWLPLKSLVAAQGVNRQWRHLVPLANILPARRALLNLYIDLISSPGFLPTRPAILTKLQPHAFDREAYAAFFRDNNCPLPEEFLLWVLEWPNKAVIGYSWPGLELSWSNRLKASPEPLPGESEVIRTIYFSPNPPFKKIDIKYNHVETQISHDMNGGSRGPMAKMRVLEIADTGCGWSMYLILDGPRKDLIGTLYSTDGFYVDWTDEMLFPQTWVRWLRWQMERISGEYDKERERRHTARVLAEIRRRDVFMIMLQDVAFG